MQQPPKFLASQSFAGSTMNKALKEPTVRQLAEAETLRAIKMKQEEHKKMIRETTLEDIEDFEHNLGLRNRRSHVRWHEREKDREEEARRMGVKPVKPQRAMSPLQFYDYEVPTAVTIPISPPRASTAMASTAVKRSRRTQRQNSNDGAEEEEDGFEIPEILGLTVPAPTLHGFELDANELRRTLRNIGERENVEYMSYKAVNIETKTQDGPSFSGGVAATTANGRPKSVWTTRTMLEPIFLPETVPFPNECAETNLDEKKKKQPFLTSAAAGEGWQPGEALGTPLTLESIARGFGQKQKLSSSWEETIGKRYFEKRLREFERHSKKLQLQQMQTEFNQAAVFNEMRELSLDKMKQLREEKASAAYGRREYFPRVMELKKEHELIKQQKSRAEEDITVLRMGMTEEERKQEAEECYAEIRYFEDQVIQNRALSQLQRKSQRSPQY